MKVREARERENKAASREGLDWTGQELARCSLVSKMMGIMMMTMMIAHNECEVQGTYMTDASETLFRDGGTGSRDREEQRTEQQEGDERRGRRHCAGTKAR